MIWLAGHPGHRRVTLFQAALAAQGLPPARVLAWRELAEPGGPARLLADAPARGWLRLDSCGEDAAVERALIRRGEAAARAGGWPAIDAGALAAIPEERGRILWPRQHQLGFEAVLAEIEAAAPPELRFVQPVAAIRELFDKAACAARWPALGIPMPAVLPGGVVRDPDDLRARMRAADWPEVYVKLTSGSSASCLALFTHDARGERVLTTVEHDGAARYNTMRLQRLTARAPIDRVLRFILGEGAHVERAYPKPRLAGRAFDCRVLAIAGEAAFVVVRTSAHPITNLQAGGTRGDLATVRAQIADDAWDAAMASCVAVQRATGAFHVGVDLLFELDLRTHRVIEGNAFGDLLPNLARDGLDVYGWQITRLRAA